MSRPEYKLQTIVLFEQIIHLEAKKIIFQSFRFILT